MSACTALRNALRPCAAILLGIGILAVGELPGQDVQPRVYTPAPVGVNLATLAYAFSTGPVLFDKTIPIDEAEGDIHSISAGYSRSFGVAGRAGRVDVALPFVIGDWEGTVLGESQSTSRTGLGDPTLRLVVAVAGAPALSSDEFAGFEAKTVVGVTVRVGVPLGLYDSSRLINLGSNRWTISPQVGVSHATGSFLFEGYAGAWFFTHNTAFLGTRTLVQDPLFTFQVHAAYRFRPGLWLAVSSRQSLGGATAAAGAGRLDPESNSRVGLTLALPIEGRYSLRLVGTTGVTATVGNEYNTFVVVWQAMF
jgi:hypothetical protein